MRKILFRGKRKDNGEWVEGDFVDYDKICTGLEETSNATGEYYGQTPYVGFVDVIHKTVGQYTGLNDKNGKKVFEGDIVKTDKAIYVCFWDNCNFEYGLKNEKEDFGLAHISSNDIEVIGNIHDNPELMESGGIECETTSKATKESQA